MGQVERSIIDALRALQHRDLVRAQHVAHHVDGELVVAGRHRRMRREHDASAHGIEVAFIELEPRPSVELPLE